MIKNQNPYNKKYNDEYGIIATIICCGYTVIRSSVYHVCLNYEAITRHDVLCNRLVLNPIHFTDWVEDFFTEL